MFLSLSWAKGVCRLRLDFESFTILGTGNSEEFVDATNEGGMCLDMFSITVSPIFLIVMISRKNNELLPKTYVSTLDGKAFLIKNKKKRFCCRQIRGTRFRLYVDKTLDNMVRDVTIMVKATR